MANYDALINALVTSIEQRVTTKNTTDSIDPVDVGGSITDLAETLRPILNTINGFDIIEGTAPPINSQGIDGDVYIQDGTNFAFWKKVNGAWVNKAAVNLGINIVDGNINVQSSISGNVVTATAGQWGIDNVVYQTATQTQFNLNASDLNLDRIDAIFGNKSNTLNYVAGTASANPDLTKPVTPADEIIITYVTVPSTSSGNDPYISDSNTPPVVDLSGLVQLSPSVRQSGNILIDGFINAFQTIVSGTGMAAPNFTTVQVSNSNSRIWRYANDVDGVGNLSIDVSQTNDLFSDFFRVVKFYKNQNVELFKPLTIPNGVAPTDAVNKSQLDMATPFDSTKFVASYEIKENLRPLFDKLDAMQNTDPPLEVMAIGNSITNFQETGTPVKTDRTVEPQCLYGNTYLRWLWRRLNFTFSLDDVDPVDNANFAATNPDEWGNMGFIRLDNSSVGLGGDFIPSGTRISDGEKVYWSDRQNINGLTTCLGGFRVATPDGGTASSSIGDISLHNHVYWFTEGSGVTGLADFTVPANAKGFSVVFWGDEPSANFPKISGATNKNLSSSVQVYVNGILVEDIDQTAYRGQTRINIPLVSTGSSFPVRVINNTFGVMNLWGLEYWTGKAVRVSNYAASGNQASAFYNNPTYMLDKPVDFIFWEATIFNNVWGNSDPEPEHIALGNLLKAKNVPILSTTVHPLVEGVGNNTNFPEVAIANPAKYYQHKDTFSAQKALYELKIPFVDAFGAFKSIAVPLGYTGSYNDYFIDGTHVAFPGHQIYQKLFSDVLSWRKGGGIATVPTVVSGVYTPTLVVTNGGVNVTTTTANSHRYTRVGNIVTVYGTTFIQTITNVTNLRFTITLPIPSNIGVGDLSGSGSMDAAFSNHSPNLIVYGVSASDLAEIQFNSVTGGTTVYYSFSYTII